MLVACFDFFTRRRGRTIAEDASQLIDKPPHGPTFTRSFPGSGCLATRDATRAARVLTLSLRTLCDRSQLMRLLERLYFPLRKPQLIQVPIRPLARPYLSRPAAAMDLSTDATERVRMSPFRIKRVWLTIMAEGLGAS